MCLRFTGKTIVKNIEFSLSNGIEPATHENARMPISNRLRSKGILERDRCAIGWSYIYDHSTNSVNWMTVKCTVTSPSSVAVTSPAAASPTAYCAMSFHKAASLMAAATSPAAVSPLAQY